MSQETPIRRALNSGAAQAYHAHPKVSFIIKFLLTYVPSKNGCYKECPPLKHFFICVRLKSQSGSLDGLAYVSLRFPNLEEANFCKKLHRHLPQTWNDVPLFLANLCGPAIRKIVILKQT